MKSGQKVNKILKMPDRDYQRSLSPGFEFSWVILLCPVISCGTPIQLALGRENIRGFDPTVPGLPGWVNTLIWDWMGICVRLWSINILTCRFDTPAHRSRGSEKG